MSATILVIEDDPASLELITYLLAAHGYRSNAVTRGDAGLAAVQQQRPDLIICDIQLPGMDGYAIARALKSDAATRDIPIMGVSAMSMVGDREKGLAAGFDAYASKPIDPITFVAQLHPLLKAGQRACLTIPTMVRVAAPTIYPSRDMLLVVDDSSLNLELNRSILEPVGYRVLTAETVADGLQLARKHCPALIISDLSLPQTGGFDFLRMLKADPQLRHTPVIIITATYRESAARSMAMSLGAARFLVRPLESEQVLREVESCLAAPQGGGCGLDSGG